MRLDAATTTKSAKSYQDLKCKIEQCGGRCLRGGETCRLVPDAVQQKIWMGALKKVGKAPAVVETFVTKTPSSKGATKKPVAKPPLDTKVPAKKSPKIKSVAAKASVSTASSSKRTTKKTSVKPASFTEPPTKGSPKTKPVATEVPVKTTVTPSSSSKSKNISDKYIKQKELEADRKKLVDLVGEEKVRQAEKKIKALLDAADLHIRVPGNDILEKIIDDRFKSQFETKTSKGTLSGKTRKNVEDWLHGYDKSKTLNEDRPIYGYIANADSVRKQTEEGARANYYGNTIVRLKPDAKKRATVTGDDSIKKNYRASSAEDPNLASFVDRGLLPHAKERIINSMLKGKKINDMINPNQEYWEAQIHERVEPSDIAEIVYTEGEKPSDKVKAWATKNGVKLTIAK